MAHEQLARDALQQLSSSMNIDRLVVQSMPFGNLVDAETRAIFGHVSEPAVAYGLVGAAKGLKWALARIDELERQLDYAADIENHGA